MSHLPRISKALTPQASAVNDAFQDMLVDLGDLPEAERLRLLAAMTAQLAAMTAKILN